VRQENEMFTFKKTCIDCHFICRQYHDGTGGNYPFEITQTQRKQAQNNDFTWQKAEESLGCYKGVWDEGHNFPTQDKYKLLVKKNRGKNCYFSPFQPGTFLNAAEKLYDRKQEMRTSTRNYRITIYGLIIAIIGLLIKLILGKG
jgi:hypothetical protein